ncbi:membrane-associated oxidoreductase [Pseudomonas sp. TNT2022 ID233]|uniref:membrane-associated oxidoreductase n=1 Tax=Pseudomonas aphyarum TaxID=2942629 RepID=UPI002362424F|nr:membrane-associated oxidoreductase [Pseudomonas aphyarum]MDD1138231.1 membrane-associated oxidoreductase [Pseudomonas aphyarum]
MMPHGRLLTDFSPLRDVEIKLLEKCRVGQALSVSAEAPEEASEANSIRAEFLRFLLLGGDSDHPVHELGVQFKGVFIEGQLNLEASTVRFPLKATHCFFAEKINFIDTKFECSIVLDNSVMQGMLGERLIVDGRISLRDIISTSRILINGAKINGPIYFDGSEVSDTKQSAVSAEGATIKGDVFLTDEFRASGCLNFMDAHIHGQFNCESAVLKVLEGKAVKLDGAVIYGDVFFHNKFSAKGTVSLIGATITGQLNCDSGDIEGSGERALSADGLTIKGDVFLNDGFHALGEVSFSGAEVGGDLSLEDSSIERFSMERAKVEGALVLRNLRSPLSLVSVTGSCVSMLFDSVKCWGDRVFLNGFVFKFIHLHADSSAAERIEWLDRQHVGFASEQSPHFHPQPWRQLKKVYEEMGYAEEAREIGIAYEERLRKFGLIGQMPKDWKPWRRKLFSRIVLDLHYWYGKLTGFGYRPHLLLGWFVCVWLGCSAIYWGAASHGVFAPSNPMVFQHDAYVTCRPDREAAWQLANPDRLAKNVPAEFKGEGNWYLCPKLRSEYTGFSPIAFSLDLLLPLVDLHQENDWAPLIDTPKANVVCEFFSFFFSGKRMVRFVMWIEILSGWVFSLLFVAVVSGLTKRKD